MSCSAPDVKRFQPRIKHTSTRCSAKTTLHCNFRTPTDPTDCQTSLQRTLHTPCSALDRRMFRLRTKHKSRHSPAKTIPHCNSHTPIALLSTQTFPPRTPRRSCSAQHLRKNPPHTNHTPRHSRAKTSPRCRPRTPRARCGCQTCRLRTLCTASHFPSQMSSPHTPRTPLHLRAAQLIPAHMPSMRAGPAPARASRAHTLHTCHSPPAGFASRARRRTHSARRPRQTACVAGTVHTRLNLVRRKCSAAGTRGTPRAPSPGRSPGHTRKGHPRRARAGEGSAPLRTRARAPKPRKMFDKRLKCKSHRVCTFHMRFGGT